MLTGCLAGFGVVGEQGCWCLSLAHIEVIERCGVALADLMVWLTALEGEVFCFAASHAEELIFSLCWLVCLCSRILMVLSIEHHQGQSSHQHQGKWKQWAVMRIGCLIKLNTYTQILHTRGSYLKYKIVVDYN